MKITYLITLLLAFNSAFALVDYSDPAPSGKKSFVKRNVPPKQSASKRNSAFSMVPSLGFETKDFEGSKINLYNLGMRIDSGYGVWISTKYWMASSEQLSIIQDSTYQAGNINTEIGFNWLSFGDAANRMTLDFAFGVNWKKSDSEFASDRTDKVFTVASSKRFNNFGLLMQYQFRLTGAPDTAVSIGNIHRLSAVLGWVATPDISFELEGALYRFGKGDENSINEAVSYSYLEPRLNLQLSRFVELQIGGRFRAQRAKVDNKLFEAKLWDLPGIYSNSIFTNLNLFF